MKVIDVLRVLSPGCRVDVRDSKGNELGLGTAEDLLENSKYPDNDVWEIDLHQHYNVNEAPSESCVIRI